jgi:iron complex transport system substrate-binding protein
MPDKTHHMKACSFLPAATKMIYDMGLQDFLYGVTFECPAESKSKPVLVHCLWEGEKFSSVEIDRIFSASKSQGKTVYYVDEPLLQQIAPDIIYTQDLCEVCQIDLSCTTAALARLVKQPELIPLSPSNLEEVFACAIRIAESLGREEAAYAYLAPLQNRIDRITDELRRHQAPPRRVMLMEWIEPGYNCGHWIPFQIACAGGVDMLSNPGGGSVVTSWEKVLLYDPQVLVIAPCGFGIERSMEELQLLTGKKNWDRLTAVRNKRVFFADYDLFTEPCPSTLTDGIELLAALFHPAVFDIPEHLVKKQASLFQNLSSHVHS